MEDSKPVNTPMITGCKLSKNDESLEVDHTMYRSMIDNSLYVTSTRLDNYLKQQGYKRGDTDSNLYIKIKDKHMIIVVVYVDDTIVGSNLQILSVNFASEMNKEFEVSMLGELKFFLGLEVYQ